MGQKLCNFALFSDLFTRDILFIFLSESTEMLMKEKNVSDFAVNMFVCLCTSEKIIRS